MADQPPDQVLEAVAVVVEVFEMTRCQTEIVEKRAEELKTGRVQGATYAQLVAGASGPLVIDVVSELLESLLATGSRLRRAEARALYAEGLSMDKIATLMRVSRQRVSAIINSPYGEADDKIRHDRSRSEGLSLTLTEYRMFADSLPHIAWLAGPDGVTEYLNRQGIEFTGTPQDTNYAWKWSTVAHPDEQEAAERGWELAIETETPYEFDYRIRRFDGEFRWHRFRSHPVRGPNRTIVKWIGTATDIDDQKGLEEDLRQAERSASESVSLLEAVYAAAPVGFGLIDDEFRVVWLNQRLAEINGAPLDEQIGRTVAELVPDLWPTLEPALQQVRATGEAVLNLEVIRRGDGDPRTVRRWQASYYPVRFVSGPVTIGLVAVEVL